MLKPAATHSGLSEFALRVPKRSYTRLRVRPLTTAINAEVRHRVC
jgi:hypothetical protein